MREAWKRETYVRSQSFSSESAVKYLYVGRRKIQISPPPGEQDKSNALPQGQQRQFPTLCPAPPGFTLIGALFINEVSYSLRCKQKLFMAGTLLICRMFVIVCFFALHRLVPVFKAVFMARLLS